LFSARGAGRFRLDPRETDLAAKNLAADSLAFFLRLLESRVYPIVGILHRCNYTAAELINRFRHHRTAKMVFISAIALNLLLLGYYKYTNFIVASLGWVTHRDVGRWDIVLPLAISFFTFTQISYLADVYRNQALHYRFLDYALFVVFFPHLIAGPIVRHWEIIPQFAERRLTMNLADINVGIALFLIGLYKKVLLADPVSNYVAAVYGAAGKGITLTWADAWLSTLAFALQIYFDFSAYSDMAIGLARLFGIKFPINFDSPYQAGSIGEFWTRWHMTLTRFLRDYLYIPLGGNRCGPWRQALNILVTMLLSGLWHGAGWTYVIWGGLHGVYLVVAHRWRKFVEWQGWRLDYLWYRLLSVSVTFLVVFFAWVFFRAPNVDSAMRVMSSMVGRHGLTMTKEWTNRATFAGLCWKKMGGRFVPKTFETGFSKELVVLVFVMMIIALLLPNAQQMLASYAPALEPVKRPGLFRLKLGWGSGLFFGVAFFWVVRTFYVAAPSPFLYFNF
jgi:alginate O-acetyltransferase complex protein AlgI